MHILNHIFAYMNEEFQSWNLEKMCASLVLRTTDTNKWKIIFARGYSSAGKVGEAIFGSTNRNCRSLVADHASAWQYLKRHERGSRERFPWALTDKQSFCLLSINQQSLLGHLTERKTSVPVHTVYIVKRDRYG